LIYIILFPVLYQAAVCKAVVLLLCNRCVL